jgi:hypothetical protein
MDIRDKKSGNTKNIYVAVFGSNDMECLQLILLGWVKNLKLLIIKPFGQYRTIRIIKYIFFIKKYINASIEERRTFFAFYKGLCYEAGNETLDLTLRFYDKEIKNSSKVVTYYSRIFNTVKFEAYVKKEISLQIYELLRDLHIARLSDIKENAILMIKNPLNEFAVKYIQDKYGIKYRIEWVIPKQEWLSLLVYYRRLFIEIFRRGIAFNKRKKKYKLCREAAWGFHRSTLRDDIIIDDDKFKKNDILMLDFGSAEPHRKMAFEEAKKKGFDAVSIPELKININTNILGFLWFYFLVPIHICLKLLIGRQAYLCSYILAFHERCFPFEILLNLYDIKCYISTKDCADTEEPIIFDKYSTRSVIFHWSDLTSTCKHSHNFIAHNYYFFWGNAHYDYNAAHYFVDNRMNTGCIFKKQYSFALKNKEAVKSRITNLQKDKKIVTFFDTSFNDDTWSYVLLLDFLEVVTTFCKGRKDVNVLWKPKSGVDYGILMPAQSRQDYNARWNELSACNNFNLLGSESFEESIAISDACVSMAINTPALVALICKKDALYFDNTGNRDHLFAQKYMNEIVFEDGNLLIRQLDNILEGKFRCSDVISEEEIRSYDSFTDDNALDRIKDSLYELTLT